MSTRMSNFERAMYWNALEFCKSLVENDINELQPKGDHLGWTPLQAACNNGKYEFVKYICEKYVQNSELLDSDHKKLLDINHQNHLGHTALHIAARKGEFEMVKCLCEAGANVEFLDLDCRKASDLTKSDEIKDFLLSWKNDDFGDYILK